MQSCFLQKGRFSDLVYLKGGRKIFGGVFMKKFRFLILTLLLWLSLSFIAMLLVWLWGKILPFHYENFVNQGIKIGFIATVILLLGNYLIYKKKRV